MSHQPNFLQQNGRFLHSAILIIIISLALLTLTLTVFGQDTQPTNPPINEPTISQTNNAWGNPLPDEIGYQGQLVDTNGLPQVGSYTMEFAVLSGPPNYTMLYTETQTVSTDQEGLFNVMVGAVQPGLQDALLNGDAWLEVKLEGELLAPRQPVGSVAYALYAQHLIGGTGSYSVIAGGRNNDADGNESVIGGGLANTTAANQATISGGWNNHADSVLSTVSGGSFNNVDATGAVIGGGSQNVVTGTLAIVGGGFTNYSGGNYAVIGGGRDNDAYGQYTAIAGGRRNATYGEYAVIAGGDNNDADGYYSTIGGGSLNTTTFAHSTVGGGNTNHAYGESSTIGGGQDNDATGSQSTISGGSNNTTTGDYSTVSGGSNNSATGDYSIVGGGNDNVAGGNRSFAAGFEAHANHDGTFVWSSSSTQFSSTTDNQFLIDAPEGVGIGTANPRVQLDVVDTITNGYYVAAIENDAVNVIATSSYPNVLVLQLSNVSNPHSSNNFIHFRDQNGTIGAIDGNGSGGVTYRTTGADFAEYLPLHHADEALQPGDVVGLVAGGVGLQTAVSDRVLVVSSAAGFVGNASEAEGREDTALVAFMGQVPVRVRGAVQAGDLLVASGLEDGTAVSISPSQLSPAQANQIVGQALESSNADSVTLINTLVGLPTDAFWAARLSDTETELNNLEARLTALESSLHTQEGGEHE